MRQASEIQLIDNKMITSVGKHGQPSGSSRKLKVVIVQHSLPRVGGAEQVLYDLITGLKARDVEPVLCCLYSLGELGERLRDEGCKTYENVARGRVDPRNIIAVKRVLEQERADILYVIDAFHNMVVGRLAAMLSGGIKTVIAFHTFDTVLAKVERVPVHRRFGVFIADRLFHPFYHRVIALAESHKRYLSETKKISANKIKVIHNGINHHRFMTNISREEARARFDFPIDRSIVGIVASLNLYKSHDVFLRVAASIKTREPGTLFVIAGQGPERENLKRMADELGLSDDVLFLGQVKDVPALLRSLDVSVLTSFHEAFPLALLESMAAEIPVVASDVGSVDAIVENGVNGYRVAFGDVESFTERVVELLRDPERAHQFGVTGRCQVEEKFTLDHMLQNTEHLFRDLVEENTDAR